MADRLVAAVAFRREYVEGAKTQETLHGVIAKYANASLYIHTPATIERIRKQMVALMAKKYFPMAMEMAKHAATPILESMGGGSLVQKGSSVRGEALRILKKHSKLNMAAFRAELNKELGLLSGEVEAAFARALRDGVARKQLITDLVASHKAELARIRIVRTEVREKAAKLRTSTRELSVASKRKTKRLTKKVKAAQRDLLKSKGKMRTTKDFFARFETKVQGHARDTMRRQGYHAQEAVYRSAGFGRKALYTWITTNGAESCPDCEPRHGDTRTLAEWAGDKPGDGQTVCGASCMCDLVPNGYLEGNDSLAHPIFA